MHLSEIDRVSRTAVTLRPGLRIGQGVAVSASSHGFRLLRAPGLSRPQTAHSLYARLAAAKTAALGLVSNLTCQRILKVSRGLWASALRRRDVDRLVCPRPLRSSLAQKKSARLRSPSMGKDANVRCV